MTKLTKLTRSGLQISPYKRLLYPGLALLCLISMNSTRAAVDENFQFPVFDYSERSIWTPIRVLGSLMAKQNGHYQKCQRDIHCNMIKYHEWFTYITSNGLQLKYNKDTFKLKQWSK